MPTKVCSELLPVWIVLAGYATEVFDQNFEFSDFYIKKINIKRAAQA